MDPKLSDFFNDATTWKAERKKLRTVLRGCKLAEELKWRKACYSFEGNNIGIMQPMKAHLAFMLFKGALLKDSAGVLHAPGKESRHGRRFQFTSVSEIVELTPLIQAYVREAIEVERAGLEVPKVESLTLVAELEQRLAGDPELRAAFSKLTPGRQRAYNLYFSGAKQAATREKRIDKYITQILQGKGLRD